jgi:hypothetical protein
MGPQEYYDILHSLLQPNVYKIFLTILLFPAYLLFWSKTPIISFVIEGMNDWIQVELNPNIIT